MTIADIDGSSSLTLRSKTSQPTKEIKVTRKKRDLGLEQADIILYCTSMQRRQSRIAAKGKCTCFKYQDYGDSY
jgi:hypothetical protein